MRASEVRKRILADHRQLRELLDEVAELAREVTGGARDRVGALRERGEALQARLLAHMELEDARLAPVLRQADAWGEARAQRLAQEHEQQRAMLRAVLEGLRDEHRRGVELALELRGLVDVIRDDMEEEERVMLDEKLLRDDVVGVDVETG